MPRGVHERDLAQIDDELLDGRGEQLVQCLLSLEARAHVQLTAKHQPGLSGIAVCGDDGACP